MAFDRSMRRLFPLLSRLTYYPLFKAVLSTFDVRPRTSSRWQFSVRLARG